MMSDWFMSEISIMLMIMFIVGCLALITVSSSQILPILITLEMLMLLAMVFFVWVSSNFQANMPIFLVIVSFSVSEAAVGLSLMISFMQLSGSDYMNM